MIGTELNTVLGVKKNEAIYTNRALTYIQMKEFRKAIEDCERALDLNPNFGKAHKRMSKAYLGLGDLDVIHIHIHDKKPNFHYRPLIKKYWKPLG